MSLLDREVAASERVLLQGIAPPLSSLLDAYLPEGQRLQDARPVLQLALAVDSRTSSASSISATLAAFTALARFARCHLRVRYSREHRRAFWMRVFASGMMAPHWSEREHWEAADALLRRSRIATWMLEAPDFPVFHVRVILRGQAGPALESTLAWLIGTSTMELSNMNEASPAAAAAAAPIDVTLDVSALDTVQPDFVANVVNLTRRLLTYDPHQQQFALQSVRYTSTSSFALQVALQRGLLSSCEVRIREVYVVTGSYGAPTTSDEAASVRQLIGAALKPPRSATPVNALECVRFAGSMTVREFAAVCSALRYGSSLRVLELVCSFANVTPDDTRQCWRWLAFGLFNARSHGSLCALHELVLHQMGMSLSDAEAFERTLANPSKLALADPSTPAGAVATPLKLCTIAPDAVLYATPSHASARINEPLDSNQDDRELEVLCEYNGWHCVVVPCHGLAWVEATHVRALRKAGSSSPVDTYTSARRFALTLKFLPSSARTPPQALRCFFKSIGEQIQALSIVDTTWSREYVQVIRAISGSCVHVQHLALRQCTLAAPVVTALVTALRGPLGRHLLSLDLNESASPNRQFPALDALTALLVDATHLPALQELRLDVRPLTAKTLVHLDAGLLAHPHFACLELQDLYPHEYKAQKTLARARREFSATHNGRVLHTSGSLDMRQRMAFVSVLCANDRRSRLLDAALVAQVLAFVSDAQTLRIAWRTPPPIHYRF